MDKTDCSFEDWFDGLKIVCLDLCGSEPTEEEIGVYLEDYENGKNWFDIAASFAAEFD